MKSYILFLLVLVFIGTASYHTMAQAKHHRHVVTKTKYRRPWSKRAKGAAIGGGAGAVVGGLAGHSVKGALIGGALGAGAGYVIGNETDKNKSRSPRQKVVKRKVITDQ